MAFFAPFLFLFPFFHSFSLLFLPFSPSHPTSQVTDTSFDTGRHSFSILARSGRHYHFHASSIEEKSQWLSALNETHGEISEGGKSSTRIAGSLIAPVRRRQTSSDALQGRLRQRVAVIETDQGGVVIKFNAAAERIFGYHEHEVVGQSVDMLMAAEARPLHTKYLADDDADGATVRTSLLGRYRRMHGQRKDGQEFSVQISVEITTEGRFRIRMLALNDTLSGAESGAVSGAAESDEYKIVKSLRIKIFDARDLGGANLKPNTVLDPYCVLLIDSVQHGMTTTKRATKTPFWGEEFLLDHIHTESGLLTVAVNSMHRGASDPRIGQASIDMRDFLDGFPQEMWAPITVMRPGFGLEDVGALRLRCTLIEEKILPSTKYGELLEVVMEPDLTVAYTLAAAAGPSLEEVAGTLVNIFAMNGHAVEFIKVITTKELTSPEPASVIFRGNSLTTKVIDLYMKMVGSEYLRSTLVALLEEVYSDTESCEIDPERLEKGQTVAENHPRLTIYVIRFWEAIAGSVSKCPPEFGLVFDHLKRAVIEKWGDKGEEQYTIVSGFVFLRFFCPAILNPYLFGLMDGTNMGIGGE